MSRLWSLLERRSLMGRLMVGFIVLLLAILLLGIQSMLAARDIGRQAAGLYQRELMGISRIKEANIHLISTGRLLRQMVLAPTFIDRDEARAQLDTTLRELETQLAAVRPGMVIEQEKRLLNEFELAFSQYKRNIDEAITLIDRSNDYQQKATAYVSGAQFNEVGNSVEQSLRRMVAIKEEGARNTADEITRYSQETQWLVRGLLAGALLCWAAVAISIGRSLRAPPDSSRYDLLASDELHAVDKTGNNDDTIEGHGPDTVLAPVAQASIRILVVEDQESSQEVTAGLQANADCEVAIASSEQAVLELLAKRHYDVVLMNMQMPMIEGINATLEIRKNPALDRLPIIAMTANSVHQDRERCLAAGMDGHIAKPIDPDELYRALMCWISPDTPVIDRSVREDAAITAM